MEDKTSVNDILLSTFPTLALQVKDLKIYVIDVKTKSTVGNSQRNCFLAVKFAKNLPF